MTSRKLTFLITFYLLFSVQYSIAQLSNMEDYNLNASINELAIDGDIVWAATESGLIKLNRLTGEKTIYTTENSELPSNYIQSIAFGSNGLWVGTGNGLANYHNDAWTIYTEDNSLLPSHAIWSITIDEDGSVWIGTYDGGIARLRNSIWTVYNKDNSILPINWITDIAIDNDGIVWVSTYGEGVLSFDGINWQLYTTSNSQLIYNMVWDIEVDSNNSVWFASSRGIAKLENSVWTSYNQDNSEITDQFIQSIELVENTIYYGTSSNGLGVFKNNSWSAINEANSELIGNSIADIQIDSNGHKWLAGRNGYLFEYDENGVVYTLTNDDVIVENGFVKYCDYDFSIKNIIMPSELDGQIIEGLEGYLFYSKGIEKIRLPNSIWYIGDWCFRSNSLAGLAFPESLKYIGDASFSINNIENILIPSSVVNVMCYAFDSNNLKSINFESPSMIRSIGTAAFGLNSFALPENDNDDFNYYKNYDEGKFSPGENVHESVGDYWYGCGGFYAALPVHVIAIDDIFFNEGSISEYHSGYTQIEIPESINNQLVTTIASHAFKLNVITAVKLPPYLQSIGEYSFYRNNLATVDLPNRVLEVGQSAFELNTFNALNLPAPSIKDGYAFARWENALGENVTSIQEFNLSYSAFFNLETYDIVYINEYGSHNNPHSYTIESETINLSKPLGSSNTFEGWYTTSTYEENTLIKEIPSGSFGNLTLYAKWQVPTSIDEENEESLVIAPNPATSTIIIKSDSPMHIGNLEIYSSTGMKVKQVEAARSNTQIDISDLPKGIYLVSFDNMQVKKLVKN